jgi:uncharacterized membrane protein YphA (DoxX/SURF4 family)
LGWTATGIEEILVAMETPPDKSLRLAGAVFGAAMIGFGAVCLVLQDAVPSLEPLPASVPAHALVGIITAVLLIAMGVALVVGRWTSQAALTLATFLSLWVIALHLPRLIGAPTNPGVWVPAAEVIAIAAAAWLLVSALRTGDVWPRVALVARVIFGATLVAFGLSHHLYHQYVESVIPAWIPAHKFFTYATGAAHAAAGASFISGIQARVAATLLAVMFGSWVVLLHIPRVVAASGNKDEWTSLFVAVAMCGGSWILRQAVARRA